MRTVYGIGAPGGVLKREEVIKTMQTPGTSTDGTVFPWQFFVFAYAFTWLVLLPTLFVHPLPIPLVAFVAVAQFGPSLAAFVLAVRSGGWPAAGRLAKRALDFHIPLPWLLVVLVLPAALAAAAFYVNVGLGNPAPKTPLLAAPFAILPTFFFILLLQGPVPEEFGWRGYALDRLQARWSALTSSVVLGALWGLWHLPLFFIPGVSQSYMPLWSFLLMTVALAVLITWVYNNTGRNLLAVMLFHASINLWSFGVFPPLDLVPGSSQSGFHVLTALFVVAAAVVVAVWGRRMLQWPQRRDAVEALRPRLGPSS